MSDPIFYPIVSNRKTNDVYKFHGGTTFENLRTGQTGEVPEDLAAKVFAMEPEASEMINEYPLIGEMINRLNLKLK